MAPYCVCVKEAFPEVEKDEKSSLLERGDKLGNIPDGGGTVRLGLTSDKRAQDDLRELSYAGGRRLERSLFCRRPSRQT